MTPTLVRFTSPHHDRGLYLDVSNIAGVIYIPEGDNLGTWVQTYRGSLWQVAELPDECAELIRAAEWGGGR